MFTEFIANGLMAGSLYALAALGYTLIYGVLRFVNFAHGEFMMVGAFVTYYGVSAWGMPLPAALLLSFLMTGLLGIIVERCAYRPLYRISRIAPVISSLGVSLVLRSSFQLKFGAGERAIRDIDAVPTSISLLGVDIPLYRLDILMAALLIMVVLHVWISKSRTGRAISAVAQSPDLAQSVGINLFATIVGVFFIASGVGGVCGSLVALDRNLDINMGLMLGFKGFTASIIGGIGSIKGAFWGGLVLGLCEHLFAGYLSTSYRDSLTFVFLVVFLLIMPQGLFGKKMREA